MINAQAYISRKTTDMLERNGSAAMCIGSTHAFTTWMNAHNNLSVPSIIPDTCKEIYTIQVVSWSELVFGRSITHPVEATVALVVTTESLNDFLLFTGI